MTTRKTTKKAVSPAPANKTAASGAAARKAASAARVQDIFAPTAPDTPPVVEPSTPAPGRSSEDAATPCAGPNEASWILTENFRPERSEASAARRAAAEQEIEPVSPGVATMLTFLARTCRAHSVVEIGSGTGVSGLALFAGMVSDGVLTSIDTDSEAQGVARRVLREAGIPSNRFRLISGDALTVMPKLSDTAYDLVFIDGDKLEYSEYIEQAQRLLRPNGVLVVNNALWYNLVADTSNDDNETIVIREALEAITTMDSVWLPVLLPVGNGLLVAARADG